LFILGHMCWGYIAGKATSSFLRISFNPYLVLLLAALPDIDLLLGIFGIQHRTWTHSILFWSLAFVPLFVKYRKRSIPYFVAPIQHIIFGDAIVGAWNRPLWPLFTNFNFTLGYSLLSIENIVLEATGLAIFLVLMFATKNGRMSFFENNKRKVLNILPIVPLVSFVFFLSSYGWIANMLVDNGILKQTRLLDSIPVVVQHQLFPYAIAMHVLLICALSIPLIWGFKTRSKDMAVNNKF